MTEWEGIVDELIKGSQDLGERVIAVQFPPGYGERLYRGFIVREAGTPGIVIDGRSRG